MVVRALRTGADCFTQHEEDSSTSTQSNHAMSSLYHRPNAAASLGMVGQGDPTLLSPVPMQNQEASTSYVTYAFTVLRIFSALTHVIVAISCLIMWASMARQPNSSYLKTHSYFTTDIMAGIMHIANQVGITNKGLSLKPLDSAKCIPADSKRTVSAGVCWEHDCRWINDAPGPYIHWGTRANDTAIAQQEVHIGTRPASDNRTTGRTQFFRWLPQPMQVHQEQRDPQRCGWGNSRSLHGCYLASVSRSSSSRAPSRNVTHLPHDDAIRVQQHDGDHHQHPHYHGCIFHRHTPPHPQSIQQAIRWHKHLGTHCTDLPLRLLDNPDCCPSQ